MLPTSKIVSTQVLSTCNGQNHAPLRQSRKRRLKTPDSENLAVRLDRSEKTTHRLFLNYRHADMAELVDATVLGTVAARRGGSSPSIRTSFL